MIYKITPMVPPGGHKLPPLPYTYHALEPVIDAKTLQIHHDRHHKKYVDDLNQAELALSDARKQNDYSQIQALENKLAFNGSGHILHSIYWTIMSPPGTGKHPGELTQWYLQKCFGNYQTFQAQMHSATAAVEASGWGILGYSPAFGRLEIFQCEKHQNLTQWGCIPILVCDVWEHAYYLKYQNNRADYITNWFQLIDWPEVERRLIAAENAQISMTR